MATPTLKPLDWPPIQVEINVPPEQLSAMIARVETNFEAMGETEPHWSVLTADRYKGENFAAHEAEFYESGKGPVDHFRATAERCGIDLSRYRSCFELGCGVGRSTIHLAKLFPSVIAADISRPHLRLTMAAAERFGAAGIQPFKVSSIHSLGTVPDFDVFFSMIVLQHNPPPIIATMLSTILGRLAPGGVACFQVPTYRLGYRFEAAAYLARPVRIGQPEMHVIPQPVLHGIIEAAGCRLLEMREDGAAGGENISSRLMIQKRA